VTGGSGESGIARDERRAERLRQRDVDGVVGREVVAKLPDARQQPIVRMALQGQIEEVHQQLIPPIRTNVPTRCMPADDLRNLGVKQMGDMHRKPGAK
jgi:hypothetical protein